MMIGPLCKNHETTLSVLKRIKEVGFDAIELNDYMIARTPMFVRILTSMAGMPTGKGGKLDWVSLIRESGLEVSSIHTNLGALESRFDEVVKQAKSFNVKYLVITGMYRFDYTDRNSLDDLANRLNKAGAMLIKNGIFLLYHNHNVEFKRLDSGEFAYSYLVDRLDPEFVNLEFDSYWASESGVNIYSLMEKLGNRIRLHHINDRGNREKGPFMTPILKSDSMELGTGCLDLSSLLDIDRKNETEYVVLETHRNHIEKSRIKSLEISADYLNRNI